MAIPSGKYKGMTMKQRDDAMAEEWAAKREAATDKREAVDCHCCGQGVEWLDQVPCPGTCGHTYCRRCLFTCHATTDTHPNAKGECFEAIRDLAANEAAHSERGVGRSPSDW